MYWSVLFCVRLSSKVLKSKMLTFRIYRVVTVPLHNSNGVVNSSNGEDPIPLRPPILHSHMVEVDMQHKVEQLEVVMVVHHKQQRPKDGVLNHHNLPLAVDMDKSQAMEGVDQFGVLATRVVLKDQHHILVSGCCLFNFVNFLHSLLVLIFPSERK